MLEDSGDAALGEQENVAVSLGPHCATAGDIMNQVDLGREGEGGRGGGGGRRNTQTLQPARYTYMYIYLLMRVHS